MKVVGTMQVLKKFSINISIAFLLGQFSCIAQQGASDITKYSEDLSYVRPKFDPVIDTVKQDTSVQYREVAYIEPKNTVNATVNAVLDSIDKLNAEKRFVDGFTIQIYSGQNREDAIAAKSKMVTEVSDLEGNLQYSQPKFRVTVGRYFNKLEAQKDLLRLRSYFSNAILVPEKILIN